MYVERSNNIFKEHNTMIQRMTEHNGKSKLLEKDSNLFIVWTRTFNKSLTLDIENRLMHYMMTLIMKTVHNLR